MISLNLFSSLQWTSCLVFVEIVIYGIGLATFVIQLLTKKRWQVFPDPTKVFSNFKETLQNEVPKILLSDQSGVGRIIAAPYALTTANFQIFLGVLASLMYFSSYVDQLCSYYEGNNCLVANDHKLCFMFKDRCQHDQTKLFLWTNFAFIQLLVSFATTLVVGPCIDALFKKLQAHISLQASNDLDERRMVGRGMDDLGAVSAVLADAMLRAVKRMESDHDAFGQSNIVPRPVASNRALLVGARDGSSLGEAAMQRLLSFTGDDDPDGAEVKAAWSTAVFNTHSRSHRASQQLLDRLTATLTLAPSAPTAPEGRVAPLTQPAASPTRGYLPGSVGHLVPLSGVGTRALMVAFVADLLGPGSRAARAYTALAQHRHLWPTRSIQGVSPAPTTRPSCCRVWLITWMGVVVALNIILTLVTLVLALDPRRLRLPRLSQTNSKEGWRVLLAVGIAVGLELLVQGVSWFWLNRWVPELLAAALDLVKGEIEAEADHMDQLHEIIKSHHKEEGHHRALSSLSSSLSPSAPSVVGRASSASGTGERKGEREGDMKGDGNGKGEGGPPLNRAVARRGMKAPRGDFFVSAAAADHLLELWLPRDRARAPAPSEGHEEVNIPPEVVLVASYSSFFPSPLLSPSRVDPSSTQSTSTQRPPTPSASLLTLLHTPYSKSRGVCVRVAGAVKSIVLASWLYGVVMRVSVLGVPWQVFWIRVCVLGMVLVLVLAWARGWIPGIVVTTYSALYGLTLVHQCIRTVIEVRHELESGRRWQAAMAARLNDKERLWAAVSATKDEDESDQLEEKQAQCPSLDKGDKTNQDQRLVVVPAGPGPDPATEIGIGTGTSPSTAASRKTSFSSHPNNKDPDIAAGGSISNKEWPVSGPRSVGPPLVLIPEMRSIGVQTRQVRSLAVQTAWSANDEEEGQGHQGGVGLRGRGGERDRDRDGGGSKGASGHGGGMGYRTLQSMDFPRPFHDDATSTDSLHTVSKHNDDNHGHDGHHHHQNRQQQIQQQQQQHGGHPANVNASALEHRGPPQAPKASLQLLHSKMEQARASRSRQHAHSRDGFDPHPHHGTFTAITSHIPHSHEMGEQRGPPQRGDLVSRVDELHRGRAAELAKGEGLHAEGRPCSTDSRREQRVHRTSFDAAMGALIGHAYDDNEGDHQGGVRAHPRGTRAQMENQHAHSDPRGISNRTIRPTDPAITTSSTTSLSCADVVTTPHSLKTGPGKLHVDTPGPSDDDDDDDNGQEQQRLRDEAWRQVEEEILIEVCSQIDTMPSPICPLAGLTAHTAYERALLRAQRRRQVLRARALRDAFARDAEQRYADSLSPRTIKKLVDRYYLHQVGTFDVGGDLDGNGDGDDDDDENDEGYVPSSVHAQQGGGGGRGGGGRGGGGGGGGGGGRRGDVNYVQPQETRESSPLQRDREGATAAAGGEGGGGGGRDRSGVPRISKGATSKASISSVPPKAKSPRRGAGEDSDPARHGSPSPTKKMASSPSLLTSSNSIGKSVGKGIDKSMDIGKDAGGKKGQGLGKISDQGMARSPVKDKSASVVDSPVPQGQGLASPRAQKQEQAQFAVPSPSNTENRSTKDNDKDKGEGKGNDKGNGDNVNGKGKDKDNSVFERLYSKRKRHEGAKAEIVAKEVTQTSARPAKKKQPFWIRLSSSSTGKETDQGSGNGNDKDQGAAHGARMGLGAAAGEEVGAGVGLTPSGGLKPPGDQDDAKPSPFYLTGPAEVVPSGDDGDDGVDGVGEIARKGDSVRKIDPVLHESAAAEGDTWDLHLHSAVKRMATDMVKNITTISNHK